MQNIFILNATTYLTNTAGEPLERLMCLDAAAEYVQISKEMEIELLVESGINPDTFGIDAMKQAHRYF